MMRVDLGCGTKKKEGFVGVDKSPLVKPEFICNLGYEKLPFEKDSVSFVYSSHCLEHVHKHKFMFFLEDLYRVSKHGCTWLITVPFYNSREGHANIDHHTMFDFNSFDQLLDGNHRNYYSKVRLKKVMVTGKLSKRGKWIPFPRLLCHSIGQVYDEIVYEFKVIKKKGGR